MGTWPTVEFDPLVTIHTWSLEALGAGIHGMVADPAFSRLTACTSAAYVASNRAILIPCQVGKRTVFKRLFCLNGGTVSGNVDVGVYDERFTRRASAGSTAQAGTNAVQYFDVADFVLGPGRYYLAVALDNATGTLFRNASPNVTQLRLLGMAQQASAFPLPNPIVLAAFATVYIPVIGMTTRTV